MTRISVDSLSYLSDWPRFVYANDNSPLSVDLLSLAGLLRQADSWEPHQPLLFTYWRINHQFEMTPCFNLPQYQYYNLYTMSQYINNSHSVLFTCLLLEPDISSTKTGCIRDLQFHVGNVISDIIKIAHFGRSVPLMLYDFELQQHLVTHSIFIFFFWKGGGTIIPQSASITRGAWTGGSGRSAPCWWPRSEPLIEKPAWCTEVWRPQKIYETEV